MLLPKLVDLMAVAKCPGHLHKFLEKFQRLTLKAKGSWDRVCFPQTHFQKYCRKENTICKKKTVLIAKQNSARSKKSPILWRVFSFLNLGKVVISEVVRSTLEAVRGYQILFLPIQRDFFFFFFLVRVVSNEINRKCI